MSEPERATPVSAQKKPPYSFWWPSSEKGHTAMALVLVAIGSLMFVKGCVDEDLLRTPLGRTSGELVFPSSFSAGESFVKILFLNVFLNIAGSYFIINVGRFVYYFATRSETARTFKATRNEKAELESLQRKLAIKELKDKLGADDDTDRVGR